MKIGNRGDLDDLLWHFFAGIHELLLELAGRVPDDLLTYLRTALVDGDLAIIPDTVAGSAATLGISLRPANLELLQMMVGERDLAGADLVAVAEDIPATDHRFAPVPAGALASGGSRIPASLDLSGCGADLTDLPDSLASLADLAEELTDLVDEAVVMEVPDHECVIGLWRAWRFGPAGPPRDARRVFLVEVAPDTLAWDLEARIRSWIVDTLGDGSSDIEVYWAGDELTPYHRAVRANAALLWARGRGADPERVKG
ncbi:hypothetical protein GCM10023322_34740 [Rugosimonospora acidiphila]|uniref:Uncharacterized protein n=1 Tax=Rugosimonospora acidiphila TaxID=556531 RepID=A0ABP9RW10_9ACTN